MGRGWPRMLWSQLQPTLSLQTATVGLGTPPNCTAPGHCSNKGIGSLHNITRQKCEWLWSCGAWGTGLGSCLWGWRSARGMERCWAWGWIHDVGHGWEMFGLGSRCGAVWGAQVCERGQAGPRPSSSRAVGQASTSSPTHRCPTWPWGWCCLPGPSSCSAPASSSWSNSSTPCSRGRWPRPSRRS